MVLCSDFVGGSMELAGKIVLVTGSALRLGKGIALALAREGAHLVIHYGGSEAEALQTAAEVRVLGVEAITVQADLADPSAITRMFDAVREYFGRLDVLVNNAASFHKVSFEETSLEIWDQVMAVNLRAPFLCIQQAAPLMRPEGGLIVNISDLAGVYAWQGFTAHGVSKAGIIHLTKQAARELAPDIRVNAIVPGPILPAPGMPLDIWKSLADEVPLKRTGNPEHIAQTVIFLAHNDFLTGDTLTVDGGEALLGPAWH
jgi:pteridine reductase